MAAPNDDQARQIADALSRMTGNPQESGAVPHAQPPAPEASEQSAPRKGPPPPRHRPAVPELTASADSPFPDEQIDDDRVNMPAPTQEMFLRKRPAFRQPEQGVSLEYRRTIIPILLTTGILFPALGGLWFLTDIDSPFRKLNPWIPVALIGIGVLLFLLGLLNAMHLKHLLARRSAR